jgi:hypothetical protein
VGTRKGTIKDAKALKVTRLCKFPTVCIFYYYPPIAYLPIAIHMQPLTPLESGQDRFPSPPSQRPCPCASQESLYLPPSFPPLYACANANALDAMSSMASDALLSSS